MRLLAAEIRKLVTVRTTWIITILGLAMVAISVQTIVGDLAGLFGSFDGSDERLATLVDQIGNTSMIVLVVAILAVTTEFRHGTVGRSLQLTPSRTRFLTGKLGAGGLYAIVFVALGILVVLALAGIGAARQGVGLSVGPEVGQALWQGVVGMVLVSMFGVALGALIRSQVIAVTVALLWVFMLEQLIAVFLPRIGRWLPFQALNAIFVAEEFTGMTGDALPTALEPGIALLTFLAWVVVTLVAAATLMRVRDV